MINQGKQELLNKHPSPLQYLVPSPTLSRGSPVLLREIGDTHYCHHPNDSINEDMFESIAMATFRNTFRYNILSLSHGLNRDISPPF